MTIPKLSYVGMSPRKIASQPAVAHPTVRERVCVSSRLVAALSSSLAHEEGDEGWMQQVWMAVTGWWAKREIER